MIKTSIKISDEGQILDLGSAFGLIYAGSDHRFDPPLKEFVTTSYADEEGEHIYSKTVSAAFDFPIKLFVSSNNLTDANDRIQTFNKALYTEDEFGIKTFKTVTFFIPYKKIKIVGTPSIIELASDYWRDSKGNQSDKAMVTFNIKVTKPSLTSFNYTEEDEENPTP